MKTLNAFELGLCLAVGVMCSGCNDLVRTNIVAGLQDGAITTTTGLINTFFEQRFSVATSTDGEEGGDDLFVQM